MYVYDIGYGTYEESNYVQFMHTKKFTEAQLRRKVIKAIIKVLKWIDKKRPKEVFIGHHGASYSQIDKYVVRELEKAGFRRVEFQAKFDIFGWPSLTDSSDWSGHRDGVLDRVYEAIPTKLRESVTALGKQQEEEMLKEMEERQKAREKKGVDGVL